MTPTSGRRSAVIGGAGMALVVIVPVGLLVHRRPRRARLRLVEAPSGSAQDRISTPHP